MIRNAHIFLKLLVFLLAGLFPARASLVRTMMPVSHSGLLETTTKGAAIITRLYDERSRLKTFTTADGDVIHYRYDSNNNLARITYPPDTAHPAG